MSPVRTAAVRLNTVVLQSWRMPGPRFRPHRMRNRDGVVLAVATAVLLIVGEITNPVLRNYIARYVALQANPLLAAGALALVFVAYTPAFGSILALVAAGLFSKNEVSRGRYFLGLGIGLSLLGLISRVALAVLSEDPGVVVWLATTATGLGVLLGVSAQIVMGSHAMALKKRRRKARRLRERRPGSSGNGAQRGKRREDPARRRSPQLPDH